MLYSEKEIFLKYGVAIIADDSAKPLDFRFILQFRVSFYRVMCLIIWDYLKHHSIWWTRKGREYGCNVYCEKAEDA